MLVDQTMPNDGIVFATKFVDDEIKVEQKETWTSPTEAALEVTIPAAGHARHDHPGRERRRDRRDGRR